MCSADYHLGEHQSLLALQEAFDPKHPLGLAMTRRRCQLAHPVYSAVYHLSERQSLLAPQEAFDPRRPLELATTRRRCQLA